MKMNSGDGERKVERETKRREVERVSTFSKTLWWSCNIVPAQAGGGAAQQGTAQ